MARYVDGFVLPIPKKNVEVSCPEARVNLRGRPITPHGARSVARTAPRRQEHEAEAEERRGPRLGHRPVASYQDGTR